MTEELIYGRTELEWVQVALQLGSYDCVAAGAKQLRTWTGERTPEALEATARSLAEHHARFRQNKETQDRLGRLQWIAVDLYEAMWKLYDDDTPITRERFEEEFKPFGDWVEIGHKAKK